MYKTLHPNDVTTVRVNGRIVPAHIVAKVIAFLCLFVIVITIGGIVLTACGLPLVDAFFSSFSCLSNIGLGAGFTGYGGGYDLVPDLGKWVLSFLMLVGRLELLPCSYSSAPDSGANEQDACQERHGAPGCLYGLFHHLNGAGCMKVARQF